LQQNNLKVLILGCGYVGTYVAHLLLPLCSLLVTTRSKERLLTLKKSFSAALVDTADLTALEDVLKETHILIVTIAAKHSSEYATTYLETALNIKKALTKSSSVTQIIYTSSTSVYGDAEGLVVTEESPCLVLSEQGKLLIETEKVFLSLKNSKTSVVIFRLCEIYGPRRTLLQRVEKLQGKKAPGDGSQPAHLIHVEDVARAIVFATQHPLEGIYNLCDGEKISRKELYDQLCHHYGMSPIIFDPSLPTSHHSGKKQVSNEKILRAGFILKHPRKEYQTR